MIQRLSTDGVSGQPASKLWREIMCESYYTCDIPKMRLDDFTGAVSFCNIGGVHLTHYESDASSICRLKQHVDRQEEEQFLVILPHNKPFYYVHQGKEGVVAPNTTTMFLTTEPYTTECSDDYDSHTILLPSKLLRSKLPHAYDLSGMVNRRQPLLNGLLRDTVDSIVSHLEQHGDISEALGHDLSERIVDLIALTLQHETILSDDCASTYRQGLKHRILNYISKNLSDKELTPAKIAKENGISVSYLHKIFQDGDASVCRFVQEKRLERCRERLESPAWKGRSIAEIAFGLGFNNQAHFSSSFKNHYGKSPREVRWEAERALLLRDLYKKRPD